MAVTGRGQASAGRLAAAVLWACAPRHSSPATPQRIIHHGSPIERNLCRLFAEQRQKARDLGSCSLVICHSVSA